MQDINVLQEELARLYAHIAKLETSLAEKPDYGLGEGDPAIVRWELDQALLAQSRERVASLTEALAKLEQGTYGICERCGGRIHPDRLAVLPDTKVCIECARHSSHRRLV
ncbi:MAG: TraR/DksA C4-type zinc finger protein [Anaerolineae bacterium]|nr:TraR/DksA C4-type zinc finger protein [Anaerolineae bacterium]